MSRIRIALIIITVAAGILSGLVAAGTLLDWRDDVQTIADVATAAAAIISALGWIVWLLHHDQHERRGEYDRREAVLIQVAAWLAEAKVTKPFPRVP